MLFLIIGPRKCSQKPQASFSVVTRQYWCVRHGDGKLRFIRLKLMHPEKSLSARNQLLNNPATWSFTHQVTCQYSLIRHLIRCLSKAIANRTTQPSTSFLLHLRTLRNTCFWMFFCVSCRNSSPFHLFVIDSLFLYPLTVNSLQRSFKVRLLFSLLLCSIQKMNYFIKNVEFDRFFPKKGFFGRVLAKKTTFINWKSNLFLFFSFFHLLIFSSSHLLIFWSPPFSRLPSPCTMPRATF
jgi:hypothetical protein